MLETVHEDALDLSPRNLFEDADNMSTDSLSGTIIQRRQHL